MKSQFFVTGIGTNVGKTVVSTILTEKFKAHYWKPVQAGDLDYSDSIKVRNLTSKDCTILPEKYKLNTSASPHLAAEIDNISIELCDFELPNIHSNLIIEGAGGVLVPINNHGNTYLDVIKKFNLPTIIVSQHYLGSINHTLLTLEILKKHHVQVEGIVFVGEENTPTESIIEKITNVKILGRIPLTETIDSSFIQEQASNLNW